MRFIAGALVVLAGSMLWGVGTLAVSWAHVAGGNYGAGQVACWGGFAVVCFGCALLVVTYRQDG